MRYLRLDRRPDSGAVAVMVAILAVVFFSIAAMAVDLGNAWARKRDVQKQVDVSAIGAGWMLPMKSTGASPNAAAIAAKVAEYLNKADNLTDGQSVFTASTLRNGVASDGEIYFENPDGTSCVDDCDQMRVVAPPAKVGFGFARVMGFASTEVRASGTVRVESALVPKKKTLPFWFPSNCGLGPSQSDTTGGNQHTPDPTPTPTPTGTGTATPTPTPTPSGGFTPEHTATANHSIAWATPYTAVQGTTVSINGITISNVPNNTDRASLRFYAPDGSFYIDKSAITSGISSTVSVPAVQVGPEITSRTGDWYVFAMVEKNNQVNYSDTHLTFTVTSNAPSPGPTSSTPTPTATVSSVPTGCTGPDRGNFGQLDTPRLEGGTKADRLAKNIALGLDHQLVPYDTAVPGRPQNPLVCDDGNLIAGAQLDTESVPGNNCIAGDIGNDGPKMYDGMISGTDGHPGRLDADANGHTSPLCAAHSISDVTVGHTLINNDRLSCFLRNGATLADLAQPNGVTQAMLDPAVIQSPRFVWLPVVFSQDRAQHGYQPIRTFVPGFITDETRTTAATSANGLDIDGNSIKVIHVFTFNRSALPESETSDTTSYDPAVGGAIVRLVG